MQVNLDVFPALFALITVYYLVLFILSRRRGGPVADADLRALGFVILVPALNEASVIAATVRGILSLPGRIHVVVVDDGSDDGTAEEVRGLLGARVHLLRRELPEARRGKGRALNAAYNVARAHVGAWFADLPPGRIVVGVTDADCEYRQGTVEAVVGVLSSGKYAGVQVPVSIRGADRNLWLLLQDMEFMGFYHMTQRARNWLGNVGMGGNGQFIRLTALKDLGDAPWGDCLTEDIDIAMALVAKGHRLAFASAAGVVQQGLTSARRLIRQRTRWVYGHYQVWRRIPELVNADASFASRFDAIIYLLFIVTPLLVLLDYVVGALSLMGIVHGSSAILRGLYYLSPGAVTVFIVGVAFVTQAFVMAEYITCGQAKVPWYTIPGLVMVFAVYSTALWVVASFCAGWKAIRRDGTWAKTQHDPLTPGASAATGQ